MTPPIICTYTWVKAISWILTKAFIFMKCYLILFSSTSSYEVIVRLVYYKQSQFDKELDKHFLCLVPSNFSISLMKAIWLA